MITPRQTRLVRVRNLRKFRRAIVGLWHAARHELSSVLTIVPNAGAARLLGRALELGQGDSSDVVTRDEMYSRLLSMRSDLPHRLAPFEREALIRRAAHEASAQLSPPPFRLRPGLVAEMLRLYDQLRRLGQKVGRFEELLIGTLERDAELDHGAERMLQQTRLLASTFRAYERRLSESGGCDEHTLREGLLAMGPLNPVRAVIVTVADWIADPDGLYPADFDLLTRLPGLERIDIVTTQGVLASGFHQRVHDWLPGLEEVDGNDDRATDDASERTVIAVPPDSPDRPWSVYRDREEELIAIARRLAGRLSGGSSADVMDRVGIVYKRPLPYIYLVPSVFGDAGIPFETSDALPLAAEPFAAAIDEVLELVASSFTRESLIAMLRSPHFRFDGASPSAIGTLNRALSDSRYLGGLDRLEQLAADWPGSEAHEDAGLALHAALAAAKIVAPLGAAAPASRQLERVQTFLQTYLRPLADEALDRHEHRVRSAMEQLLEALRDSCRHDDPEWDVHDLTAFIRRWIEEQTFAHESTKGGVQLVDDQAARYGDFEELSLVGLIEGEWPERPPRNIFYPSSLLAALGWPSERARRSGAEARFVDLLSSASSRVDVSTITLDDEALVEPASLLDEITRAGLPALVSEPPSLDRRLFVDEALSIDPVAIDALDPLPRNWAELRLARSPSAEPSFHGQVESSPARRWSVSAIETYLDCPFRFFAQHVLKLEEEPDDEEVMDPRKQGQFIHAVFEDFFTTWQAAGKQSVTPENLDEAQTLFEAVVERHVQTLPTAEAALERTRLLGSPAAAGLGEAVLRMEAERPVAVVGRLLEKRLEGDFRLETAVGSRTIALSGKADRLDLLADGTFRLIDYKLGWPPNRSRALQLPIYALCAEQRLDGHLGTRWTLGEAAYVAFKGPRRIVPLLAANRDRAPLAEAQERLVEAVDAIERGEFPPRPFDVFRCETCAYSAVCRTDYVGDV